MIDYRLSTPGVDLAWDAYRDLYLRAFPAYDERQAPTRVLAGVDGDRVLGFVAGYPHTQDTFYIQHIGFCTTDLADRFATYVGGLEALHQYGWRYLLGAIDARNPKAITWALKSGFRIIGTRQSTDGALFVEVLREAG